MAREGPRTERPRTEAPRAETPPPPWPPTIPGNRRILIVDDDPVVRTFHGRVVESLGYTAELAADGVEALTKLPLEVDLVLLDVDMAHMDGFEVAKRIREQPEYRLLPIIMVTGLDAPSSYRRAMEAGANDLIAKPMNLDELRMRSTWLLDLKDAYDRLRAANVELGDSVEHARSHLRQTLEDLTDAHRRTRAAHLDMVRRLTLAAEYKDQLTDGHPDRVGRAAAALARALGWSPSQVETLRHAASMHDVGKLGLPDEIVLKSTPFDDGDRALMQRHTTIGAELLEGSGSEIVDMGARIALCHHERWDGGGYPRGLRSTAIPIEARICAVVDCFDATTMDRPHRPALPLERALGLLRRGAGKRFDPGVIDAFFGALPEIERAREGRAAPWETSPSGGGAPAPGSPKPPEPPGRRSGLTGSDLTPRR